MFSCGCFLQARLHFLFFSVSFLLFMSMLMLMLLSSKLLSHTLHWHGIHCIAPAAAAAGTAHSFQTTRHLGRVASLLLTHTHTYIITCLWENTRRSFNTCTPSPLLHVR